MHITEQVLKQLEVATEDQHQALVVDLLRSHCAPDCSWFAVPNGGHRSKVAAARLKKTGTRAGAPDIMLFVRGQAHAIEMKRHKGGKVSPEQKQMFRELTNAGVHVSVCHGAYAAIDKLLTLKVLVRPDGTFAEWDPISKITPLYDQPAKPRKPRAAQPVA